MKNKYNADEELYFEYDEKLKELTNYLRLGKKGKIYNYTARQTKPIEFFNPIILLTILNLNLILIKLYLV